MAALHKRTNFDYIATREAAAVQEALPKLDAEKALHAIGI